MDPDLVRELYLVHERFCRCLADPKRLLIMNALAEGERCVGDLTRELNLRQANVSQHLAVLRDHGVVGCRRQGAAVYYSLTSPKFLRALALLREVLRERMTGVQTPALAPALSIAAWQAVNDGEAPVTAKSN